MVALGRCSVRYALLHIAFMQRHDHIPATRHGKSHHAETERLGIRQLRIGMSSDAPGGRAVGWRALSSSGQSVARFVALAFVTLVLALAGQAPMARGTLQASNAPDGVVDRSISSDNGILPKAGVRAQTDRSGPRSPLDHDPSPFIASTSAAAITPLSSGGAWRANHYQPASQSHGLVHLPRGPPSEEAQVDSDRVSRARVAAFRSVDSFLPLQHGAPSRMMA